MFMHLQGAWLEANSSGALLTYTSWRPALNWHESLTCTTCLCRFYLPKEAVPGYCLGGDKQATATCFWRVGFGCPMPQGKGRTHLLSRTSPSLRVSRGQQPCPCRATVLGCLCLTQPNQDPHLARCWQNCCKSLWSVSIYYCNLCWGFFPFICLSKWNMQGLNVKGSLAYLTYKVSEAVLYMLVKLACQLLMRMREDGSMSPPHTSQRVSWRHSTVAVVPLQKPPGTQHKNNLMHATWGWMEKCI